MATSARGDSVPRQFTEHHAVVERHFRYLAVRVPDAWISAAFAFGLSACCLASSAADIRYGVVGFVALTGLLVLLYPHFVLKANARNAILWLYPAWMVLSTAWSIDADRTFHSLQLLLPTIVAALALGAMPDRRAMQAGAALALLIYICLSFVYGQATQIVDGTAFAGVTHGKNYFGHLSAMAFIMSLAFLAFATAERGRMIVGLAGVGWFICGLALLQSRATGSLIAAAVSMGVFVAVVMFRRIGWPFKLMVFVALTGAIVLYATFGNEIEEAIFDFLLKQFNKDRTLTGRAEIWDYGDRLIALKPWLGHGFNAFWYFTNPDAWTIWRMAGVQPMSGFNFHNSPREILVDGGIIGLVLYYSALAYCFIRALLAALASGDAVSATRVAFITYFLMRMGVESTGFAAVTVDTLLLFGFLCVTVDQNTVQKAVGTPTPRRMELD